MIGGFCFSSNNDGPPFSICSCSILTLLHGFQCPPGYFLANAVSMSTFSFVWDCPTTVHLPHSPPYWPCWPFLPPPVYPVEGRDSQLEPQKAASIKVTAKECWGRWGNVLLKRFFSKYVSIESRLCFPSGSYVQVKYKSVTVNIC
jgi:hypothetical protein